MFQQRLVQRYERPRVVVLPIELARLGGHRFHRDDRHPRRVLLQVRQRLSDQLLLEPQPQGRLANAGRTVHEDERRARQLAERVAYRLVGVRQPRMGNHFGCEVRQASLWRLDQ